VDEVSIPKTAACDLIIGTYLLSELALDLSFSQMRISWKDLILPMKEDGLMSDRDAAELSYIWANETPILKEAED